MFFYFQLQCTFYTPLVTNVQFSYIVSMFSSIVFILLFCRVPRLHSRFTVSMDLAKVAPLVTVLVRLTHSMARPPGCGCRSRCLSRRTVRKTTHFRGTLRLTATPCSSACMVPVATPAWVPPTYSRYRQAEAHCRERGEERLLWL